MPFEFKKYLQFTKISTPTLVFLIVLSILAGKGQSDKTTFNFPNDIDEAKKALSAIQPEFTSYVSLEKAFELMYINIEPEIFKDKVKTYEFIAYVLARLPEGDPLSNNLVVTTIENGIYTFNKMDDGRIRVRIISQQEDTVLHLQSLNYFNLAKIIGSEHLLSMGFGTAYQTNPIEVNQNDLKKIMDFIPQSLDGENTFQIKVAIDGVFDATFSEDFKKTRIAVNGSIRVIIKGTVSGTEYVFQAPEVSDFLYDLIKNKLKLTPKYPPKQEG